MPEPEAKAVVPHAGPAPTGPLPVPERTRTRRIVFRYLVLSFVAVFGLDWLIDELISDPFRRETVKAVKDLGYLALTAILLGAVLRWVRNEARNATARLEDSETGFRSVLDGMLEGCQLIGRDWRYLYLNDVAVRHNRRPRNELIGVRYQDAWPGIESTEVFAALRRCLEQGVSHRLETQFAFPGGARGWFQYSIQPVPEGIFVLSIDISERKRAQDALRQWADAFEHCAHGISLGLPGANRVLACNPAFARMLGRSAEELTGMPLLDLYDPAEQDRVRAAMEESDRLGQTRYEARMRRRDGASFPVLIDMVSVLGPEGKPLYRVETTQEIAGPSPARAASETGAPGISR